MRWFQIAYSGDNFARLSPEAEAQVALGMCKTCRGLNPFGRNVSLEVQVGFQRSRLNFVASPMIGLIRDDCLKMMNLARFCRPGIVRIRGDVGASGYHSFGCLNSVIVRGGMESTYQRCLECGRHMYFGVGEKYLLSRCISRMQIFAMGSCLLIPEECLPRGLVENAPDITIEEIGIRDDPVDGHPHFCSEYDSLNEADLTKAAVCRSFNLASTSRIYRIIESVLRAIGRLANVPPSRITSSFSFSDQVWSCGGLRGIYRIVNAIEDELGQELSNAQRDRIRDPEATTSTICQLMGDVVAALNMCFASPGENRHK